MKPLTPAPAASPPRQASLEGLSEGDLLDLRDRVSRRLVELASLPVVRPGVVVKLAALAVQSRTVRCRTLDGERRLVLRPSRGLHLAVEGHILTVLPFKQWRYQRTACVSGEIQDSRLDVGALALVPLGLHEEGLWDPKEEYWGEPGEPLDEHLRPIIEAGPRPEYEMEQILPGDAPENPDTDPISQAVDLYEGGDEAGSVGLLQRCLTADLRTLDAHAHLGAWMFNRTRRGACAERALRHYEVGAAIGELSLGDGFNGVLPWDRIDNRPFLRCLSGLGLCRWALGDCEGAAAAFRRMLWLNPGDHQGARFCLRDLGRGVSYGERSDPGKGRTAAAGQGS